MNVKGEQVEPASTAVSGTLSAADKTKLDGITPGAAVASVSGTAPIASSGGTTPAISITAATTLAAGSMSAADKTKLDGITPGAAVASVGATAPCTSTGGTTPNIGFNVTGDISWNTHKITSLDTPTADTDAANKTYIDQTIQVVPTITARNNITSAQVGMMVNVLDNGAGVTVLYMLTALPASTSSNWVPYGIDATLLIAGDGRDGDLAPGFGTLTLTQDSFYNTVTPKTDGTDIIVCHGYRLRIRSCDLTGCPAGTIIDWPKSTLNGSIGAAQTTGGAPGGSNFQSEGTLGEGQAGSTGGAGGTGNGVQAAAPAALVRTGGGKAGSSGKGGNAGANTGGPLRVGTNTTPSGNTRMGDSITSSGLIQAGIDFTTFFSSHPAMGGTGGAGGGGGAGDGTQGGGGGGGGTGGGVLDVAIGVLTRDGTTAAGCIRCNAGNGGKGGTPTAGNRGGGGGAAGGGGGLAKLVTGQKLGSTCTGLFACDGGDGGNGGDGHGTGNGGNGADGGNSGYASYFDFAAGTGTSIGGVAGNSGSANTGITGGTGGTGGQARVDV